MAIGAAALEETLLKGGTEEVGGQLGVLEEAGFALAQGQGGEALELCLTHNMHKIADPRAEASENENAPRKRKRPRRV
jgi:hypothetical protein